MNTFFFETPSIVFELAANNHLRNNYGVDIRADELEKTHILSTSRETSVENNVFSTVMNLLKERKLSAVNLYIEFIKNLTVVEHLNRQGSSIESCIEEGMSSYSYDIGYILGNYMNNSEGKVENLNSLLKYKDNGITMPFTIDESIIKGTLGSQELLEQQNGLQQTNGYVKKLAKPSSHSKAFVDSSLLVILISSVVIMLVIALLTISK